MSDDKLTKAQQDAVQKELLDQPEYVEKSVKVCDTLKQGAQHERAQWLWDSRLAYAFDQSDRYRIFGYSQTYDWTEDSPGQRSEYHIPIVAMRGDSFVAAVAGGGIEFRYRPKVDQTLLDEHEETIDTLSRMGNAAFEAYRNVIGFGDHFHRMVREMYVFDHAFGGPAFDYKSNPPDVIAGYRRFKALQCYNSQSYAWDDAPERMVEYYVDKEELKAQYPEHADAIEMLKGVKDRSDQGERVYTSDITAVRDTWNLSTFSPDLVEASPNDVMVRELWRFDATRDRLSREKDSATIESEHALLDSYAKNPMVGEEILKRAGVALPELYYEDREYHSMHYAAHQAYIDELGKLQAEVGQAVGILDGGVVQSEYALDIQERAALDGIIAALEAHNKLHETAMEELEENEEGYFWRYEGGWRQTILLGLGSELGVYDGTSQYLTELGIKGCPIYELYLKGHPMNHWGPSVASENVDLNKIVNTTTNNMIDNLRMFGSHQIIGEASTLDSDDFNFNNDPNEPSSVPDGALREGKIQILDAKGAPPSTFDVIGWATSMSQEVTGVHNIMSGKGDKNVRSASQVQSMAGMNKDILNYYLERLTLPLSKMGIGMFKAMIALPPDDAFLRPMIDGEYVEINWELLQQAEYIIEVKVVPSGITASEERIQMLDSILQRLTPMFQQFGPAGAFAILDLMVMTVKDRAPEIKEIVEGIKPQIQQQYEQMQQQTAAESGQASPQQAQRP